MLQVSRQCLALCLLVLAAIALLLLDQRSVTSYLTPAPSTCRKTLWLVVFGTRSHESFIKVAIMSALDRAPSLVPCVSFDGQFDTLPIWMRRLDAQGRILLVKHDLQMMSLLDPFPMQKHYYGCFYKVEIPLIYDKLLPRLHGRSDVNTNYLLYTDTDVVFFRDIDDCTIAVKPTIISVVQEAKYAVWRNKFWSNLVTETEHNSGVIYVNVPAMKRIQRGMVDFAIDTKFKYDNAGQAWDDELDQGTPHLLGDDSPSSDIALTCIACICRVVQLVHLPQAPRMFARPS